MDWGKGYPTETNYKAGFYRNLAPLHLRMICALQGAKPPTGSLTYLELGCGAGLSTLLLAATNPNDTFVGVDFAPSHIVEANNLANEANISNVNFIEFSFDDDGLIEALPPCDIISLHGVYTWVAPHQRKAIRHILSKRLKTGGLFYVAYNNMVASGFEIVLQRALRELSRNGNPARLQAAFEKLNQMKLLGAEHFRQNPALLQLIDDVGNKDSSYLVHEYLTDHWKPYFFQDLAREMEDCKLSFLGSAAPADNRDDYLASAEMIDLVKTEDDPNVRQFLTDISANRRFRNDIFSRGSQQLEPEERIRHLRTTTFALAKPVSDIEFKVTIGRGVLELRRPLFRSIIDHLSAEPNSLDDLKLDDNALVEAITLLCQAAIIHPASGNKMDTSAAQRLNKRLLSTEGRRTQYGFAAAPRIGSAVPILPIDRMSLANLLCREDVPNVMSGQSWTADGPYPSPDKLSFWRSLQIIN